MPECPLCKRSVSTSREDYVKEVIDHKELMLLYMKGEWDYEMYCLKTGIEEEPLPMLHISERDSSHYFADSSLDRSEKED